MARRGRAARRWLAVVLLVAAAGVVHHWTQRKPLRTHPVPAQRSDSENFLRPRPGTQHVQLLDDRLRSGRPGSVTRIRARSVASRPGTVTVRLVAIHAPMEIWGTWWPTERAPRSEVAFPEHARVLAEASVRVGAHDAALMTFRAWEVDEGSREAATHALLALSTPTRLVTAPAEPHASAALPPAYSPTGDHRGWWAGAGGGMTLGASTPEGNYLVLHDDVDVVLYYSTWYRAPLHGLDEAKRTPVTWDGERVQIAGRWSEHAESPLLSWALVVSFVADDAKP